MGKCASSEVTELGSNLKLSLLPAVCTLVANHVTSPGLSRSVYEPRRRWDLAYCGRKGDAEHTALGAL